MARSISGVCKLCGKQGPLSKEHIPAKGGYKGTPYRVQVLSGDEVIDGARGDNYQNGFHKPVFCEECNNNTGSWYGGEFTRWTKWGLSILDLLRQKKPFEVPFF
jgi:hypothetical protein